MGRIAVAFCILLLLAIALWQLGRAGLIAAKAWAAPVLIEYAFDRVELTNQRQLPWPWADNYPIAKISVPHLKENRFVLSQSSMRNLAFGPTLEKHGGNRIFYGHRDTHFEFLKELKIKDKVKYEAVGKGVEYWQVQHIAVVDADEIYVPGPNQESAILFVTCFPFDSIVPETRQRFVVWLGQENKSRS
ncbi:hypothetical protein A9Q83_04940 [Alphaproteobacteria bacterium 46_93_T64]|nr:hypothetical protein A9Q83_04940 [Alphaproteobacteria bacterium 46_93_T64]